MQGIEIFSKLVTNAFLTRYEWAALMEQAVGGVLERISKDTRHTAQYHAIVYKVKIIYFDGSFKNVFCSKVSGRMVNGSPSMTETGVFNVAVARKFIDAKRNKIIVRELDCTKDIENMKKCICDTFIRANHDDLIYFMGDYPDKHKTEFTKFLNVEGDTECKVYAQGN